jgi:hypothetical protein
VDCNIKNILLTIYSIIKYSLSKTRRYLNLFYIIIRYKPKSILEVGVYKGIRSEEMIRAAKIFKKNLSFYGFNLFENIIHYNIGKFSNHETHIDIPTKKDWFKIIMVMITFALLQGILTYVFN